MKCFINTLSLFSCKIFHFTTPVNSTSVTLSDPPIYHKQSLTLLMWGESRERFLGEEESRGREVELCVRTGSLDWSRSLWSRSYGMWISKPTEVSLKTSDFRRFFLVGDVRPGPTCLVTRHYPDPDPGSSSSVLSNIRGTKFIILFLVASTQSVKCQGFRERVGTGLLETVL